ncbi:signal peptide peptidase SppA [Gemella sp. GH3]|uniref:signal peptide peptidase SppA n=1 Tax=unclassified Gemella TaxID=2624949 RepID=UPI0015CFF895|nr:MULTISPECIES: signal peptide peptidase SppA [unclassified Gemella]MBF0713685.1 signal peptide peptidase SppA [Gemella sp. GH3.1]NYS50637.1 signal peptide peptidase SppA [Gemella sp. GH3]
MNKKHKRLLALGVTVLLVVFSALLGTKSSSNDSQNIASFDITSGDKRILVNGDSSNIIQKITVKGTIDEEMIDSNKKYSIINQINIAKSDPSVKAILLSVNSPGGGVYESSEIYNALLNSGKDVYVSMKQTAASGGYYISMASKKIFASEETITGSLGVIISSLSAQKFLEDNGIKNQVIRSGDQKAVGGLAEDLPESTIDIYRQLNKESYDRFIDVIVKGRNMSKDEVLKLADGRIYSGKQAKDNGLIDQIGTEEELIKEISIEKDITNPQVIEYQSGEVNGLFRSIIKSISKDMVSELQKLSASNTEIPTRNYLG